MKSLVWLFASSPSEWILNIGFSAHSVIGPLTMIYTINFVFNKKWSSLSFFHFLPSLFLLMLIGRLSLETFWYQGGYSLLLIHQMAYSVVSLLSLGLGFRKRKKLSHTLGREEWIWISVIVSGLLLIQLAYFSNYILGLTPYILGPMVFPVFIYFLSFFGLKNPQLFQSTLNEGKYKNIQLSSTGLRWHCVRLRAFMDNEKPYLKRNCTLQSLANELKVPPYLLSYIINKEYHQNFSDFINTYRVEAAKQLLQNSANNRLKISSIAYDCGFNTLSTFNTWFKRLVGVTPTKFRNMG